MNSKFFRCNTYEKQGEGLLWLITLSDEDKCPEEPAAAGDEGSLLTPDEGCLS
jgi:hypothetical protein